jgi:hypothetical protein
MGTADLDLFGLDRAVRRAAALERAWRRRLRVDAESASDEAWFEPVREVTTRTTFQAVSELPPGDPLREPLRRWIHRLAMARIAQPVVARAEMERQAKRIKLTSPEAGVFAARDLVHRALAERDPRRSAVWLGGLAEASAPMAAAERQARESELEIASRLGASESSLWPVDAAALRRAATDLLDRTDDLARSSFAPAEGLAELVGRLLARDVPGVWPGGSLLRWMVEPFRTTPLLEGIELDIGPLPAVLGAASFMRAFAQFGMAYGRAAPATGATFAHAHDPHEINALRRGSLFAALFADPAFLRRQVDLWPKAARGAAFDIGRTLLASVRLDATRTLVDLSLVGATETAEHLERALSVPFDPRLCGVMPRTAPRAPFALLGALLARSDAENLRDQFDEDWFRNPEAFRHMRQVDAVPYTTSIAEDAFRAAPARVAAWLESLG